MRKEITVTAEPRESRGKNEARRLRVKGFAPAVLYGANGPAVAVAVSPKEVNKILRSTTGHNTIFNLAIQGGEDTPEFFTVDVTELMIGQNLRASDIPLTGSMKLLSPADHVIAHVVTMKAE